MDRGHTKQELEQLDDFWLVHIYWHPRNKDGHIAVRHKRRPPAKSRRQHWLDWGRRAGWPDWYSLERWEEEEQLKKQQQTSKAASSAKNPKVNYGPGKKGGRRS